jgi:hypothetical protein
MENNLNDQYNFFIFDLGTAETEVLHQHLFDDVIQSAISGGGTSLTQMSFAHFFYSGATVDYIS